MAASKPTDTAQLQELLDEIESGRAGEEWCVPVEYALELLESDRESYFRFLYRRRHEPGWSEDIPDNFGPENVRQLIDFSEKLGFDHAAVAFETAGLHFREERLLDWIEFFQSVSLSKMRSESVERELLESAIAGTRRFEDAAEFYCHCKFDLAAYIDFAGALFLKSHHVRDHHLSRALLRRYIEEQLKRRTMRWEDVCLGLHEHLRQAARAFGFTVSAAAPIPVDDLPAPVIAALRALDFAGDRMPAREELKQRYRSLLKRFHPDVNPEGMARSQTIIAAYAALISEFAG